MTELDQRVSMTVSISDTTVTRPGFGILAIVHKHQQTTLDRVLTYTSLSGLRAVFPSNTPVGHMAGKVYSQAYVPETVKVIYRAAGETMTQALDAAIAVDSDFYAIITPSKDGTDIAAGAAWALANYKFFAFSSGDSVAPTSGSTDPFSVIQALSNYRAAGYYTADAGGEMTIDSITVAGTTATFDITTFVAAYGSNPILVGDTVGVWTSAVSALNTTHTVLTVGANSFTATVASGTSTDATSSDAWWDGNHLEAAICGKMLPLDAGSRSWDMQVLSAVTVDGAAGTNSTKLTSTQQTYLGAKNANWFTNLAGNNITSGLKTGGGGGKTLSGRYIDVQRGSDWLSTNLQLDLAELMIASEGDLGYDAIGLQKVQTKIETRLNDGLDKKFLTPFTSGAYEGLNYYIAMPALADISGTDKTSRLLSGITIYANIRGKIHNMEVALTLST